MRASRLLSILTTLQAKGHVTAQALASECEVSLRTIYRDVDALSAAGIPVYSERGSSGGYRLLDGYRVRLNGLSSHEADALFLAGLTSQAADLGLGAVAASARKKLLAALPQDMRSNAIRSRFHLDAVSWFDEAEKLPSLPVIADAVWNERLVRFAYKSGGGEKRRQVAPLGIVLKGGIWYLVAQVLGNSRTYRISRIQDLEVLDKGFDYPDGFDLEAYWTDSTHRYEKGLHPNQAEIRLSPNGIEMMKDFLPPYIRASAVISPEADADGWRRVTLSVGSVSSASMELLRFGADAEVIEPPELRAALTETVATLATIYASGSAAKMCESSDHPLYD